VPKPFVKWAGGKSQLLKDIKAGYPVELGKTITRYCEPFVGGGAVLFDILENFKLKDIYISDVNEELINTYRVIREEPYKLITSLELMQDEYIGLSLEERKLFYYKMRDRFNYEKINGNKSTNIDKAVLLIFLNRTCFNGLYRVNGKGEFNVPIGSYKKPLICDKQNLLSVNKALYNVQIHCGDYKDSISFIDSNTFVYLDPPYRPLNETANFTSYTETGFNENSQIELSRFVDSINVLGAKFIVSNSDPKNSDKSDDFFDELYKKYNIERVTAKRMINCNAESRGNISEILVTN